MKKNKKYALYMIALLLVAGLSLLHPYFNGKNPIISYAHHMIWGNVIDIDFDEKVKKSNVTVIFKNEFALVNEKDSTEYENLNVRSDTIIKNGVQILNIPYDYGKQVLVAYYGQTEIGRIRLWKTNNWHSHRYYLKISKEQNNYIMTGEILGPDNNT